MHVSEFLSEYISRLFRGPKPARARIEINTVGALIYAVGDVHGRLDLLQTLEELIMRDAATFSGRRILIMLGDYVDRGKHSARVIEHLLGPAPEGFERICLAGNHDIHMLDFLEGRLSLKQWLSAHTASTLYSYGLDPAHLARIHASRRQMERQIRAAIPESHISFLRRLPVMVTSGHHIFVHAGIRPGVALADQTDHDLVTIRAPFLFEAHGHRRIVVHGHSRVVRPNLRDLKLGIDTGAFATGHLTALRIHETDHSVIST